jgi:xanthine/CO dehydrogenase XdhC/CoxF family maturation factor
MSGVDVSSICCGAPADAATDEFGTQGGNRGSYGWRASAKSASKERSGLQGDVMDAIESSFKPEAKAHDAIEAARRWLDELSRIALATVVRTWGSSPVPVGGQLTVASDERLEGSVSGGCVEAEVIFEAMDVISTGRPKLLEFGIANEIAWRAGLPCGGRIENYVEALVAGRDGTYLDAVLEARATRSPMVVRTAISNGSRELFDARAKLTGDVADCLKSGQSRIVDAQEGRVFLHALTPAVHVIIVGATHIGQLVRSRKAHRLKRLDCGPAIGVRD